ncbi:MAG TPA: hypothetical protein VFT22_33415 [Kofleriaceae bacterium]|nr:hypothetical protein [Kofleriaceae bacterium]
MRPNTDQGQDTRSSRTDGWSPERARAEVADEDRRDRASRSGAAAAAGMPGTSWQDIKSRFVDDPAGAVAAAEQLVQQAVEAKVRALQQEAADMCAADRGDGGVGNAGDERGADAANTEMLRTRLIRYQEYCERLAGSSLH